VSWEAEKSRGMVSLHLKIARKVTKHQKKKKKKKKKTPGQTTVRKKKLILAKPSVETNGVKSCPSWKWLEGECN